MALREGTDDCGLETKTAKYQRNSDFLCAFDFDS